MPGRVTLADPLGAGRTRDPALPFLERALDPRRCTALFARVPGLVAPDERLRVISAQLLRHKPGRRCLITYRIDVEGPRGRRGAVVLGKARAGGVRLGAYRAQCSLWQGGFGPDAPDGVEVPEPIGLVPELAMWLQRRAPGRTAAALLPGAGGVELARRIAGALVKLHRAPPPVTRVHRPDDEIAILGARLAPLHAEPGWKGRIERLLDGCGRLAAGLPSARPRTIHRDFYPDHAIVGDRRIVLVDLDTLCQGDPALDVGNFVAHLVEQALRVTGDATALDDRAVAFVDRYLELDCGMSVDAVQAWITLALARLVGLSTSFSDRRYTTGRLLELCEQRLSGAGVR